MDFISIDTIKIDISNIDNISVVKINGCDGLKDFINKPCEEMCKITTLTIYNCRDIQVLSKVIHNLINLTMLNIVNCRNITNIPESIGKLINLL